MLDHEEILKQTREAYEGKYRREIQELLGLTLLEITYVTNRPADPELYEALLSVVMDASRKHLTEEILVARISALGPAAVTIARLVPSLACLLEVA